MILSKGKTEKVLVLGVDGLDPRLAKKFMDQGKLPNIKKYVEAGSAREDLVMLGAMPTITPPMWTTLATGAYPMTHGITCFWNQHPEKLDTLIYAMDSRLCKAELLWNVFVESGKKALVFHWPGSSWPPTSSSENLHVIDGVQPAMVNLGVAIIDWEKFIVAKPDIAKLQYAPKAASDTGVGCILSDIKIEEKGTGMIANLDPNNKESTNIMLTHEEGDIAIDNVPVDIVNSPLKPAENWVNAPEGALEFMIVTSSGLERRPALVLRNEKGVYNRIAVYKNKKATEPLVMLQNGELNYHFVDDIAAGETHIKGYRSIRAAIEPDGSQVRMWMSCAFSMDKDVLFHPKRLYKQINDHLGHLPIGCFLGGKNLEAMENIAMPIWDKYVDWQADAIKLLIKEEKYDVVFSHIHNVDAMGHMIWYLAKHRGELGNDEERYQKLLEWCYVQTDRYLGSFLPLLDEDWTIFIVSDHGLICPEKEIHDIPLLGDAFGCNVQMLKELGFTSLKKDANGNEIREIDWENTKAVAPRGNHIFINLKGRDKDGIVDPKDKYALEEEIISALYNYRLHGRRVVSMALRNKDAVLIGLGGDQCGDIIYFLEEGANRLHGDCMSTTHGYFDTSVSPIFIGAGKGIKKGFTTDRVIREVDLAPTIAALTGVRMPAQCEGAPIYQILE